MESLTEFAFNLLGSAKKFFQKNENSSGDAVDGESKQKTVIYGKRDGANEHSWHFRHFHVTSANSFCINWHLQNEIGLSFDATCAFSTNFTTFFW